MNAIPTTTPLVAPIADPPTIEATNINTVDRTERIDTPNTLILPIPIILNVINKLIDMASSSRTDTLLLLLIMRITP